MPQRNVASNFTFEQQRLEINLLAQDFWTQKGTVDNAAPTYLKHDGSNDFTGQTLAVPNAFTINANSGSGTVTISGNLDVQGTTTTVSTANLEVSDKNILIAKGSTSDAQADGAGITIDSGTDITFNFVDDRDALVSSIGLEASTFLKGPYGQFIGSGTPSGGQGVEINAPDSTTGQIISYDRGSDEYKELRVKGSSVGIYGGTSNALVGTFSSTGLTMESGKTITGVLATAAQPNITSLGTLTALTVSGRIQKGTATVQDGDSIAGGLNISGTDMDSSLIMSVFGNDSDFTRISGSKSRNATVGSHTIVQDNDVLLSLKGFGSDGNDFEEAAQIEMQVDGTPNNNVMPGRIVFKTTTTDGVAERVRITNNGRVAIGNSTNNASPVATLQIVADDGEAEDLYVGVFKNLEATAGKSYGVNIQAGSNATDHGFRVKNKDNNETQFLVRGDGRVGVGEDQPADKFVVQGSTASGDIGIRVKNDTVTDGDNTNPTSASLYLNTSTGNFNTFYIQARRNDNNTHFGYADPRATDHVPNMCIANTGQVLIGSATENTSDRFTIVDPGNAFMSLRSDQPGDGVSQFLDFIVGESNRASSNMVSSIRSTIPSGSTAGGTLKGELSFWTNEGDSITEQLTIKDDGDVLPGSDNAQDLGSSSLRWANVYTGDMHLNNMNTGGNEVDGSEGHWTMQEGADDLFLINRNTGKKYKFNLTEVS